MKWCERSASSESGFAFCFRQLRTWAAIRPSPNNTNSPPEAGTIHSFTVAVLVEAGPSRIGADGPRHGRSPFDEGCRIRDEGCVSRQWSVDSCKSERATTGLGNLTTDNGRLTRPQIPHPSSLFSHPLLCGRGTSVSHRSRTRATFSRLAPEQFDGTSCMVCQYERPRGP